MRTGNVKKLSEITKLYYRQKFNCLRKFFIQTYFSDPKGAIGNKKHFLDMIFNLISELHQ